MYHGHGGRGTPSAEGVVTLVASLRRDWDCPAYGDPRDAIEALGYTPCPDPTFRGVAICGHWMREQSSLSLRSSGSQIYRLLTLLTVPPGVSADALFSELVYPHDGHRRTLAELIHLQQHARDRDLERMYLERHGSGSYLRVPTSDSETAPISRR